MGHTKEFGALTPGAKTFSPKGARHLGGKEGALLEHRTLELLTEITGQKGEGLRDK